MGELVKIPRPDEIVEYLNDYVIGQEEAKKTLAVAVYNHYKRIAYNADKEDQDKLDKSNIVLMGATGSGKTYLVKTIARLLNVPYYIQDCTKITASGYVGSDVEDCLAGLLRACGYNKARAERGIVMLDEGDKIAKKEAGRSVTRDVSGECVQQSLLKIVEGDVVGVPPMGGRKHPEQSLIYVNTQNILFILSGAFVGIEDIIKQRLNKKQIGFSVNKSINTDRESLTKYATDQDLRVFGMIPEFVGRFPVITNVEKLTEDDLIRILKEPKNSIVNQYTSLLAMDKINLEFTDDALQYIAHIASRLQTGARGLKNIMETVMNDIMYDAPVLSKGKRKVVNLVIDEDYVKKHMQAKWLMADESA